MDKLQSMDKRTVRISCEVGIYLEKVRGQADQKSDMVAVPVCGLGYLDAWTTCQESDL